MSDYSRLIGIHYVELFVSHKALGVVDVVLKVCDAFVDFTLCLHNRLPHLLSHQLGIVMFVFPQNVLQVPQFFKSPPKSTMTLSVFVSEPLIGAIKRLLQLVVADCLKGAMQFVVFRVDRSESYRHYFLFTKTTTLYKDH